MCLTVKNEVHQKDPKKAWDPKKFRNRYRKNRKPFRSTCLERFIKPCLKLWESSKPQGDLLSTIGESSGESSEPS